MTIDQLDFCSPDVTTLTANNIPMLGQSPPPYQSIRVGILKESNLMGVFPLAPPSMEVEIVKMISTTGYSAKGKKIVESSFLGPYEAIYDVVQSASDVQLDDHHMIASDPYHLPYWLEPSLPTLDYLTHTFSSDESIMEIMSMNESVWEDHHHRSLLLPNTSSTDNYFVSLLGTDIVDISQTPMLL